MQTDHPADNTTDNCWVRLNGLQEHERHDFISETVFKGNFGPLLRTIVLLQPNGGSKGVAFVELQNEETARLAVAQIAVTRTPIMLPIRPTHVSLRDVFRAYSNATEARTAYLERQLTAARQRSRTSSGSSNRSISPVVERRGGSGSSSSGSGYGGHRAHPYSPRY